MITNLKVISASQNSFSPPVCEMPQKFLIQILSSTYLFIRIDTYIYIYMYTPGQVLNTPALRWLCWNWCGLIWNIPPFVKQRQQQDVHPLKIVKMINVFLCITYGGCVRLHKICISHRNTSCKNLWHNLNTGHKVFMFEEAEVKVKVFYSGLKLPAWWNGEHLGGSNCLDQWHFDR